MTDLHLRYQNTLERRGRALVPRIELAGEQSPSLSAPERRAHLACAPPPGHRRVTLRPLLVVSPLDGSGPGMVMTTLALQLKARGIEPLLVATHGPKSSPLIDQAEAGGVEVVNLDMRAMVDPRGA